MRSKVLIILSTVLVNLTSAVDYCMLCENGTHTMCKYKGPAESCYGYKRIALSPEEKKYIVDVHNDIRNHVASGMELRGALGSQPPAADMLILEWDDELAEIAQRWADQCIQVNESRQHDVCKRTERFEVGQNILTAITTDPDLPELSVLIYSWYKQVSNVIPSDIDLFSGIHKGKYLIGQYTQLVWSKTKYVGCGSATFKESSQASLYQHRLVCNYGPTGNIIGEAVYHRGTPCSQCPTKKCDGVRTNLCQGVPIKVIVHSTNYDYPQNWRSLQSNVTSFNMNISESTKINLNDSKCLNLLELLNKTKCIITGVDKSNTTDYNNSSGLQAKRASFRKFIYALMSNKAKHITAQNLSTPVQPSNTTTRSTTGREHRNVLKNETYPFTLIPSTTFSKSLFEEILPSDTTVIHSSQVTKKPTPAGLNLFNLRQDIDDSSNSYHLRNGIIVGVDGERHYRRFKNIQERIRQLDFKLSDLPDETEVVLPTREHFKKAKGIWRNGHCRCPKMYRSHYGTLKSTPVLVIVVLLLI